MFLPFLWNAACRALTASSPLPPPSTRHPIVSNASADWVGPNALWQLQPRGERALGVESAKFGDGVATAEVGEGGVSGSWTWHLSAPLGGPGFSGCRRTLVLAPVGAGVGRGGGTARCRGVEGEAAEGEVIGLCFLCHMFHPFRLFHLVLDGPKPRSRLALFRCLSDSGS